MGTLYARRIVGSAAFSQAFRKPSIEGLRSPTVIVKSPHFVVSARLQAGGSYPQSRLGLIIAKRFLKSSVDRNRFKRLLRQYFAVELLSERDVFVRLSRKPAVSSYSPLYSREIAALWQDLLAAVRKQVASQAQSLEGNT